MSAPVNGIYQRYILLSITLNNFSSRSFPLVGNPFGIRLINRLQREFRLFYVMKTLLRYFQRGVEGNQSPPDYGTATCFRFSDFQEAKTPFSLFKGFIILYLVPDLRGQIYIVLINLA